MIYADYNGSAPLLPAVRDHLKRRLESELFANPNAIHSLGQKVGKGIERCRELIAKVLGCWPDQIIFNSGASEGVTTIISSVLSQVPKNKRLIITSPIEHAAVSACLEHFRETFGFTQRELPVNSDGVIDLNDLRSLLEANRGEVALVTLMAANNETGVIQPYKEAAKLCREHGVEFFSDTTQLIGKGDFNFNESGVDYAVCSGHKLGALPGTGFIMAKDPTKLMPLIFGKSQERGLRGGTQNYLGIETMAVALQDFSEQRHRLTELKNHRLDFERKMRETFSEVVIIGEKAERLAGTTMIGYPGIHGQAVQIELESNNIFVTTSAACSDNEPETSQVLRAMGVAEDLGRSVVRISLSYSHGQTDYSALAQALVHAYNKLTKIHSF